MRSSGPLTLGISTALAVACVTAPEQSRTERPYLDAARQIGVWLEATAIPTEIGYLWPVAPVTAPGVENRDEPDRSLYSGTPGVVLFLFELGAVDLDGRWTELARGGAEEILTWVRDADSKLQAEPGVAGLWTGTSGWGFVMMEAYRHTEDERYRDAALRCADLVTRAAAAPVTTTDVVSGTAGVGFYLLESFRRYGKDRHRNVATAASWALVATAREESFGLSWPMREDFPRTMPNFSHGTAGVATFLSELHRVRPDSRNRDAALAGAERLVFLADPDSAGFRVHHHEPGGEDLYYLGWCHGPVGTARLFRSLALATGDAGWNELVDRCALAIRESGIPAVRTPGFWNNVGPCCGSAGVADFFLARGGVDDVAFAHELLDDVLARGTRDASTGGLYFLQAEHRVRPELLEAQTGYMQGAAGVGLVLLRADAQAVGLPWNLRFPDEPYEE